MSATSDGLDQQQDQPIVSVIMAAKNAAPYIAEALRSALAQTLTEIEIIVVDDGSTDGTSDVVRACAGGDPRVRLLRNEQSLGVSGARNRAIREATGTWLAVLDADDAYKPERLAVLVREATARELDLLGDNLDLRDFATKASMGLAYPAELMARRDLLTLTDLLERDVPGLTHWVIGYLKPMLRRAFLAEHGLLYREDVWCGEDYLLYAQCVIEGARFGVIHDALYVYSARNDSASQSATRPEVNIEVSRVNQIVGALAHQRSPAFDDAVRVRQIRLDYFAFARLVKNRRWRDAGRMFVRVPIGFTLRAGAAAVARRVDRVLPARLASR